jgi:hypothetical protein
MLNVLQILALILIALTMVPALAHALELPGKLRLAKEAYFTVQPIYYPGFTIIGACEPAAIASTFVLLVMTPRDSNAFWWTVVALLGLIGVHAVYWFFTHPVNNFWLQGKPLSTVGSGFFSLASTRTRRGQGDHGVADWIAMRDRWEYSHVARAGLAVLSFVALAIAVSGTGA